MKWKGKAQRVVKGPAHIRYNSPSVRQPHPLLDKVYCTKFAANGMRNAFVAVLPHPERLRLLDPELYKVKLSQATNAATDWLKAHGSKSNKKH